MSFDFTVGFPLKQVISSVDPIEVELTSIDGITFYISVIFRNHRHSILGVKLRADPIEKLPITTFIEIMIKNNVKNSENYISNEVTFWPDCYTETLYPGTIKLSEISEYLSNNGKKLKFYLSLKIMENPKQLKVPNTEVIMTEDIQSSDSIDSKSVESDQKKSDYIFREQTEKNNYLMKKRKKPPILNLSHSDSSEDSQTEHLPSNSNSDYSAKNKNISNSNKNTNSTYTSTSTSTSNSAPNSISNENSNQISIETENDNCFLDECNQAKQYFIGIKNNQLLNNQDSLYLNSVFQILFHLPIFRKLVYEFHSEKDNNYKNMIPYNLQKLFYELDLASCNKKYRKKNNDLKNKNKITDFISSDYFINSLGWNQNDFFTQHSIHDFFRILFSSFNDQKILEIFKGTLVQTISQNSIQNTAQMNIKGKNGHSLTKSNEDFFNISLNIKGFNSIEESLSRFTSKESINRKSDGKNNGLTIQTTFVTLPKVLQIFLNRLEYDSHEDTNKINGQVRFPLNLDMNKFVIPNDQNLNYIYTLYCVLVHEGDQLDGGKYYTYINHFDFNKNKKSQQNEEIKSKNNEVIHESNSLKEESDRNTKEGDDFINQWLLFNNEIVKQTTENNAIEKNFGGDEVNTSAVMLIYVRNDSLQRIFDVDFTFLHYFKQKNTNNSKKIAINKRKKHRNVFSFTLITEESIKMNCLLGKFGIMNDFCKTEIEIQDNCNIYKEVAQKLNFATNKIRIWTIQNELNENNTPNPKIISLKIDKIISNSEKIENIQSTILFIQLKGENEPLLMPLIALLVKIYTRVKENPMLYVGIIFVSPNKLIKEISEVIKNSLNIDSKYKVNVFHEKGPTEIFLLNENKSISKNSLNHGSFIILDVPRKVDWSYQITACKSFQENTKKQSNIIRYCDKMLDILPESPIDFSFLYYNTQIIELVDYNDGKSYGLFEIPSRISIFQLEGFISQYFGLILNSQRNKIIFFDEGPSLHPILKIKTKNKSPKKKLYSNTSSSNEFNDTHKIFFLIVDYNFVYSESYLSLMTTFTSQKPFNFCKTFNFFIDTNEENLISIKYIKTNILDSFEDGNHNTKFPKLKIDIESLRCYWTSKETGLILTDFLNDDEEITKDDALTKILRVEVIPADQRKRKFNRLDVYQSYLNNNEKELIISGIPIILNVDRIEKSQNIKNKISNFFDFDSNSINLEKVQLYLPQNLENYGKSNISIGNQLVNSIIPFDPSFLISNDQKLTFLRNKINSIFFITNFDKVNI